MSSPTPSIPKDYPQALRKLSWPELAEETGGWREGTPAHWLCVWEVERRNKWWPEMRAWAALVTSLIALTISIVGLVLTLN